MAIKKTFFLSITYRYRTGEGGCKLFPGIKNLSRKGRWKFIPMGPSINKYQLAQAGFEPLDSRQLRLRGFSTFCRSLCTNYYEKSEEEIILVQKVQLINQNFFS